MNRNWAARAVVSLVVALAAVVIGAAHQVPQKSPPSADAAAAAGADSVVARVDGEGITEKQVLDAISQMAQQRQLTAQQLPQKDVLLFKDAVDSLIGFALLRKEAREKSITVAPQKVDEGFRDLARRFASEEEFQAAMKRQGLSEAELRKSIEESLLYQQVIELAVANLPPPGDSEIRKFYDENPQYFDHPERVHAAHILLKVDKASTPEEKAAILKKLESIRADIETKKITFAEAAAKDSDDASNAKKGGDLGFFSRGQMVQPFENASFSAEPGALTPIVETQFGYHLINVIEREPAGKFPLDESRGNIENFLQRRSRQEAITRHIGELRAQAAVETLVSDEEWAKRHGPR